MVHLQQREHIENLLGPGMSLGGDKESGPIIDIDRDGHRGRISLYGGQVLEWQPAGHHPVLWLSEGAVFDGKAPIRGGIPVCWPWFGDHPLHDDWPSHGFARTTSWPYDGVDDDDSRRNNLALPIWEPATTYWPHASRPHISYRLDEALSIVFSNMNIDPHPIEFSQALHTYFAVGDIEAITIHGLEKCAFIDKLSGREEPASQVPISIMTETDRIYRLPDGPIELRDPILKRTITIEHAGATSAVVWNPWIEKSARLDDMGPADAYRGMVCIETGNVMPDQVRLQPGDVHTLRTKISVRHDSDAQSR